MTLEDRINAVGDSIRLLVNRLAERGFQFNHPAKVYPGPESGAAAAIARIETEAGLLPLAASRFRNLY